ncbi:hypothetical protein EMPG_10205 [Blastomyces silverae]|uniref:Uncharacterized protein n=1 Tax=Blastomyces silverae TaxID=2060906 RepID=A0A0H1BAZ6_9EURO|nr:hypothetical protein EMPG_10205 [Blastomyces silverae]
MSLPNFRPEHRLFRHVSFELNIYTPNISIIPWAPSERWSFLYPGISAPAAQIHTYQRSSTVLFI